ncbi:alpha-2-macroglobulin-like protein 1 [Ornithodoros turicata]|uniref:alpha-2-macroglobulin-like protein 1 n=1 Tax=Ornithodoros turicata TaxID=34597 RepID=UPI0031396C62
MVDQDYYYSHYFRADIYVNGMYFLNMTDVSFVFSPQGNVLIQTDKPQYRQGETVKFRVLVLDDNLLPIVNQTGNITIMNPGGQIVAEHLQVDFGEGLIQREYRLLAVATEGFWSIQVGVAETTGFQSFEVTAFTLPTFSVTITPDPNDVVTNPTIQYTICAQYTFRRAVRGIVQIFASIAYYYFEPGQMPVVYRADRINGCYNYTLNVSLLRGNGDQGIYYPYPNSINLTTVVTEQGTGVSSSATNILSRSSTRILLSFNHPIFEPNGGSRTEDNTFKVGLAYKGRLYVQKQDGTPLPGTKIHICVFVREELYSWRQWNTFRKVACKNFTSDSHGIVRFTVPPLGRRAEEAYVEAIAVDYPMIAVPYGPTLRKPSAILSLRVYYSRHGQSIKIQTTDVGTLPVQSQYQALVVLTAVPGYMYNFYFLVIVGSRIIKTEVVSKTFTPADLYTEPVDDTYVLNGAPPPGCKGPVIGLPEQDRMNVANFTYTVSALSDASPNLKILVFYVLRGSAHVPDEIISDLAEFQFAHMVTLDFQPDQAAPGSNVSVILTATGNSLCGVGAVDKGVTLLPGYEDRNSRRSIIDRLRYLNFRFYSTYLVNQTYCYNGSLRYQEGYEGCGNSRSKRSLQYPEDVVSYDSLSAFEDAAVVVFTNIRLQTRPCPNRAFPGYPLPQIAQYDYYYYYYDRGYPVYDRGLSAESAGQGGAGAASVAPPSAAPLSAAPPSAAPPSVGAESVEGQDTVRDFFPETWLWQIERVGLDGKVVFTETLPDTIATWQGMALCVHPTAGFGISNLANVTAFQPLFVTLTLPLNLIRGESATVTLTVFSFIKECVAVRVNLVGLANVNVDFVPCFPYALLCGGSDSMSFTYNVTATHVGVGNLSAEAESRPEYASQFPDADVFPLNASDTVIKSIDIKPEGYPVQVVQTYLICAQDNTGLMIPLANPPDLVEGSRQVLVVATGDLLAITVNNLASAPFFTYYYDIEEALSFLTSTVYLYKYLQATGQLSPTLKSQLESNIMEAYNFQEAFRAPDGSYPSSSYSTAVFVTAFAVQALTEASTVVGDTSAQVDDSVQYLLPLQDAVSGCFNDTEYQYYYPIRRPSDLSLFIGISLLTAGYQNENVYGQIINCTNAENFPSNRTQALYAYFLARLGQTGEASTLIDNLLASADTSGGYTSWSDPSVFDLQLDTAGYVILTMVLLGRNLGPAQPIARYLSQYIDLNYYYSLSQPYTVGVQALSEYSKAVYTPDVSLVVTVTGTNGAGSSPEVLTFNITNANRLVYQQRLLENPNVTNLTVTISPCSTGCALVQAQLFYSVLNSPATRGLQINTTAMSTPDCLSVDLSICIRYTLGSLQRPAIVDITLLSGYEVVETSLQELQANGVIQSFRTTGNRVLLLIRQVSRKPTCFTLRMTTFYTVKGLQPAPVLVYEYYNSGNRATALYSPGTECVPVPVTNSSLPELTDGDEIIYQ